MRSWGTNVKKMFPKNLKNLKSELIDFTPPRRHDGKQSYIDFQMRDPSTGRLKRKKYMLDKYAPGKERDFMAMQIMANIYDQVMRGWNPWVEFPSARGDAYFSQVIIRYRACITKMVQKKVMAEKTKIDYFSRLKILEDFLEDRNSQNLKVFQFNLTCMTDFLDYILLDRDASSKTRNNYRTWLSAFNSWLVQKQYLQQNVVPDIPILPERVKFREALPEHALVQLSKFLTIHDRRFLLACMMEYYTFIRPTELTKIRIRDISVERQTVFVSSSISKNRKDGMVALNDKVLKLMIDLAVFNHPSSDYLFGREFVPSREKAESRIFRERFNAVRRELGFPDCYQFYSLKDSGIRDPANDQGIVVAKDQARHSDISVTNKYLVGHDRQVNEATKHFKGKL